MKKIKYIVIILIMILLVFIGILLKKQFNNQNTISETISQEQIDNRPKRNKENIWAAQIIFELLVDENKIHYYDDYLTDNFKNKYKTKIDIFKNADMVDEYIGSGIGNTTINEGCITVSWKDKVNKPYYTDYNFIPTMIDGQIDDITFTEQVDIDPVTYERIDGIKPIGIEDIRLYIQAFYDPDWTIEEDGRYEAKELTQNPPLSKDFQIINKPEFTKFYLKKNKEIDGKIVLYYQLGLPEGTKFYRVDYKMNDRYEFETVEYIEVTSEEYLNAF